MVGGFDSNTIIMGTRIEWEPLKLYSRYQISSIGEIRNIKTGRILKKRTDKDGYYDILLSKNGIKKRHKIHRLVALAFIPNPQNKPQVNHKNGIKKDNHLDNLEWVTKKENENHAVINDLHRSKVTTVDVKNIRKLYKQNNITMQELGNKYGILKGQVSRIINKKSWAHV